MTTTFPRTLAATAAAALLLGSLAGCSLLPGIGGGSGGGSSNGSGGGEVSSDSELIGTTWSGTDSDGDSWGLELQEDGTVGLTYNGSSYDDSADTWAQSGDTVTFHIGFDDGDVEMVGQYAGLDAPMETDGTYPGGTFTVTLTQG